MRVLIDVSAHYAWIPVPEDGEPVGPTKVSHDGRLLERTLVPGKTQTEITIPPDQIEELVAHYARKGLTKSRERVVAELLEEQVMPHHAPPSAFTGITVDGDEGAEKFLLSYFEVEQ
jgi:hypothetical protein